jgi:uncharacterized Zn finger protein
MSFYRGGWTDYVSVAERRIQAELLVAKLRKKGQVLAPVSLAGRQIATSFWGRAWCDNLESYRDFNYRLERGRSYVRNGCVVDLQIMGGRISGLVNGSELYRIGITVQPTQAARWRAICADCAGGIDSLVELLQGKFSKPVMARLCVQETGLFPSPTDIRFTCSCPDHALMCKHVAAVLYGVGARLDESPELLFRLRGVNESELVDGIGGVLSVGAGGTRVLEADDVSSLFGLDMALPAAEPAPKPKPVKPRLVETPAKRCKKVATKKAATVLLPKDGRKADRRPTDASKPAKAATPRKGVARVKATSKAKAARKRAPSVSKTVDTRAAKPKR